MYRRRLFIFLLLVFVGLLVAVGRLSHLQLVRGAKLAEQAERAMHRSQLLNTNRGMILDRRGFPLATDRACWEFRMDYRALLAHWAVLERRRLIADEGLEPSDARQEVQQQLEDANEWRLLGDWVARRVAKAEGVSVAKARRMTDGPAGQRLEGRIEQELARAVRVAEIPPQEARDEIRRIVRRVWRVRSIVGGRVKEETSFHAVITAMDEAAGGALEGELQDVSFARIAKGTHRWYPHDDLACHVIGLTGKVNAGHIRDDPHSDDSLRKYLDNEMIGLTGIEKFCEPVLRGVRGRQTWRRGEEAIERTDEVVAGNDVKLTLDITLQAELTKLLRGRSENGAIVVLSVPTGEVLALVSTPTYDLNSYKADFAQLIADDVNLPLLNRAVGRNYPAGSTVKPATAMAGVGAGVITPETRKHCQGYLFVPNAFRCWHRRGGHGDLTVVGAIKHSCNVFFYKLGEQLGTERMLVWMRRFGLGVKPGTGLPDEKAGLTPTRQWLWERRRRRFRPGDARLMAIGQGLLLATPLQIANLMATIARDGTSLSPKLVYEYGPEQVRNDLVGKGILPLSAVQVAQEGLYGAVNEAGGTGREYARHPSVKICGKTGTAQTERRGFNMVWFCGYAPRDNPQIAFAIMLEYVPTSSGGGGKNCGPLAPKLVDICRKQHYLP